MNNPSSTFGPKTLWECLQPFRPAKRWLVGFSGGLDSTVLLAALVAARPTQPVVAIHVNHGLSRYAEDWQRHCEALCRQWNVEFRTQKVVVQSAGQGVEAAAREQRYKAFLSHMEAGDVLLLGHHRDDQAETFLLRLLRGAGPRGLGAMVASRPFGPGRLVRPLLKVSKRELERYARDGQLTWIHDESNADESFDRNFLRQNVIPLLAGRWPALSERFRTTAEACQEADLLSQDLGRMDLQQGNEQKARGGWSVDWLSLAELPTYRRNNLLRTWALDRGFPIMEARHLREADKQFFSGEEPASGASVQWASTALRFYRGRLYLVAESAGRGAAAGEPLRWRLDSELPLADGSRLVAMPARGGLRVPNGQVEVRWRQGGERCQPAERAHSQSLKKLLQEYRLEPWLRSAIPLIYVNGRLAAVGDLWICKGFQVLDEPGYRLQWRLDPDSTQAP